MAYKDLHQSPFDEATIAKLSIFEDYAQAWLPTFVEQRVSEIRIFDFFAGTGYDNTGVQGSPIRILEKIREQAERMAELNVRASVYFNEYDASKFGRLKESCENYLDTNRSVAAVCNLQLFSEDFGVLFPKLLPKISGSPSLVYLDQNGIKFLTPQNIANLESAGQTDFLYFVASSYFIRFGETEEFKKYFDMDIGEIRHNPYDFIHRVLLKQIRSSLPSNSKLKLYPFSLKKGANIYGIVFGAKHIRAVDKFLEVAWKKDPVGGEANFDINQESKKAQGILFGDRLLTKLESFEEMLREKILNAELRNNIEVFIFTLEQGHLGKHAADVLKAMKKENKLRYNATSPLINYQGTHGKDKRILYYEVIQHNETY